MRTLTTGLILTLLAMPTLLAQDFEKQATDILKLYESGLKDTAYTLVEPLKQSARFVPAAIYVRAQMTPDDRALNLYREIIALEPNGAWADEAAYQLVRRYIDKKDSLASWTWYGMLNANYPQSPYVAAAKSLLDAVETWELEMPDDEGGDPEIASATTTSSTSKPASKTTTASGGATSKPASSGSAASSSSGAAQTASSSGSDFSGYALQVGLFPTKAAAEKRVKELEARSLSPRIFPKEVDGKTQYALVVGPYKSLDEAAKAKPGVSKACDCGAFTVTVE